MADAAVLVNEPLAKHTYYRIGGPATKLAIPRSLDELKEACVGAKKIFVLGLGSNILASDSGFDGTVIKASRLDLTIEAKGAALITGSSVSISTLLRRCAEEGWSGLEFLTGVPGSVGGAVYMNAGTHLGETASRLLSVCTVDLSSGIEREFSGTDLKYEYRKNLFLPKNSLVLSATWKIDREEPARVRARIDETLERRKKTQPLDYPSCGSVFKNPEGRRAWEIIDQLGLRGHQIGQARISEKHSNFIVNLGGARASDVRRLIDLVKSRTLSELGLAMHEEVIYL